MEDTNEAALGYKVARRRTLSLDKVARWTPALLVVAQVAGGGATMGMAVVVFYGRRRDVLLVRNAEELHKCTCVRTKYDLS